VTAGLQPCPKNMVPQLHAMRCSSLLLALLLVGLLEPSPSKYKPSEPSMASKPLGRTEGWRLRATVTPAGACLSLA
jgi:hypothetical protein